MRKAPVWYWEIHLIHQELPVLIGHISLATSTQPRKAKGKGTQASSSEKAGRCAACSGSRTPGEDANGRDCMSCEWETGLWCSCECVPLKPLCCPSFGGGWGGHRVCIISGGLGCRCLRAICLEVNMCVSPISMGLGCERGTLCLVCQQSERKALA